MINSLPVFDLLSRSVDRLDDSLQLHQAPDRNRISPGRQLVRLDLGGRRIKNAGERHLPGGAQAENSPAQFKHALFLKKINSFGGGSRRILRTIEF